MIELMTKVRRGINALLSTIAAIILITMSALVIYQVFTRYVLNNPADFTEEIIRYLLIWICFIGAAYAFNSRQHMALLFVQNQMKPPVKRALVIFSDVLILLFAIFVMLVGGVKLAVRSFLPCWASPAAWCMPWRPLPAHLPWYPRSSTWWKISPAWRSNKEGAV